MNAQTLTPFLLDPALHIVVWGGRKLADRLGKHLPTDQPYGEAWELDDSAVVASGSHAGRSVGELVAHYGPELIGTTSDPADGMPLLIKFLDANTWLSLQVHPNDAFGRELENLPRGKNEGWFVVDAAPGSRLINGLRPGTTRDDLTQAIQAGQIAELAMYVDVAPDDALYMPAGLVHALGPGLLIYEVQQACNITYRLYDWGRIGLDGLPRTLHIDKGTRVTDLTLRPTLSRAGSGTRSLVFDTPYFRTTHHRLRGESIAVATEGQFQAVTVLSGSLCLESDGAKLDLPTGRTALVPASMPGFTLSGQGAALRSHQP